MSLVALGQLKENEDLGVAGRRLKRASALIGVGISAGSRQSGTTDTSLGVPIGHAATIRVSTDRAGEPLR